MKNYEAVAQISTTLQKPNTVSLGLFSAHYTLEQNKPQTLPVLTRAEMQLLSTGTNAMSVRHGSTPLGDLHSVHGERKHPA